MPKGVELIAPPKLVATENANFPMKTARNVRLTVESVPPVITFAAICCAKLVKAPVIAQWTAGIAVLMVTAMLLEGKLKITAQKTVESSFVELWLTQKLAPHWQAELMVLSQSYATADGEVQLSLRTLLEDSPLVQFKVACGLVPLL